MNKLKNKSQTRKGRSAFFWLFAMLMFIVVVPVMLFTIYQISFSRDIVFAERANYLRTTATSLAQGLDISIDEHRSDITRLAENNLLKEYLAEENGIQQNPQVLKLLQDINAVINYDVLYMMNTEGECVTSTNPSFVGKNYGFRPYFTNAKAGGSGFYMAVGVTSNVPGFYFSAPVHHQGILKGVVVGKCRISDVASNFNELDASKSMKIMLVTEEGIIIATNEPSMMLNSVAALSPTTIEKLQESKQFAKRSIPSIGYDKLWKQINLGSEQQKIEFSDTEMDRTDIAVFKALKGTQWRVIVTEDQQVLLTHVRVQITVLIIAGVVACLAIAVGSYCASEIMSKSIRNVSKIISQISTGDHSVRLEPKGPKELRNMCVAFNQMIDRLVDSHHQLQSDAAELLEKNTMLAESGKRQKLIFESAPIGMIMINSQKQIVEVNTAALELLKQEQENVLGKQCDEVFCTADKDQCPIFNLGAKTDLSERVALRRDGKQIPILKSVVRIDLDGETMLIEAFVDISDRKKAENELETALTSVEETSEELAQKVREIEHYNNAITKREEKMENLKNEVEMLQNKLGEAHENSDSKTFSEDI